MVEGGTFGGTCLNVGCIPTKMFVYPADLALAVSTAARFGVDATLDGVRWEDIRDRVFGRIDPISARRRATTAPNERQHHRCSAEHARFVGAAHPRRPAPATRSPPTRWSSPPAAGRWSPTVVAWSGSRSTPPTP